MSGRRPVLAIVPARGGSKGIPHKNVAPIAGKPLIAWTLEAASQSRHLTRIVVSTDDDEIAHVSERWGAEVVRRPANLSTDEAASEGALLHVLETLETREGYHPELTVFLQCTSPLMRTHDIDGTIEALDTQAADSAFAGAVFHRFSWLQGPDGDWHGVNHDRSARPLRQDRDEEILEAGSVVVMRTAGFRERRFRFFGRMAVHRVDSGDTIDIDEPRDLALAELMLRARQFDHLRETAPVGVVIELLDALGDEPDTPLEISALHRLRRRGLRLLFMTPSKDAALDAIVAPSGVECLGGVEDSASALRGWAERERLDPARVVYLGNDPAALEAAGIGIATADADFDARRAARLVLKRERGCACIQELDDELR